MIRAFVASLGALAVVIALLELAPGPVAGQKTETGAKAGPAPKTPWGEPDLQGIWNNEYQIPLQRPARYANREFFTDEERAALDKQVAGILGREATAARRGPRGSEVDVGGAYNGAIYTSHKHLGRRTSLIVDPPDGRIPSLTPEATKRRDAIRAFQFALMQATDICKNKQPGCRGGTYGPPSPRRAEVPPYYVATAAPGGAAGAMNRADGPEDRTPGERCMGAGLPDFGAFFQIVQSPGILSIFYDTGQGQGWQRVIPVTGRPHIPPHIRGWWGDSRGRWEGNTLVVDVTNFSPKTDYQGSRENLHLVERWTRLDANTIEYGVTMEDPTTWTRPWTVKVELSKQSDQANRIYKEPRCHEGNYGLPGLLAGMRAAERAFAERRGPDPATLCVAGCGGFAGGFADEGEDSDPLNR